MRKISLLFFSGAMFFMGSLHAEPCESKFMVRLRGVGVVPQEHSRITPVGGKASVSKDLIPELDLSYFFTKNIAVEAIAGTSYHKVKANGTSLGNLNAGSVRLLPPTVTLQYHWTNCQKLKPYVGAGPNYTFFFNKKAGVLQNVHYKNNAGVALQAGADIFVQKNWFVNLDVKKVFLKTTAEFSNRTVKADVHLNPWFFGIGVGSRF